MATHNISPVREQIRSEIMAALATGAAMSAAELYDHCPSATESSEIARIAHDMRRTGRLETGDQVIHALGMRVNTYRLPTDEDPRIAAAQPIVVERKIPRTVKVTKPAATHPFNAPISPRAPQDRRERVTRDLPIHLTTTAPQAAAVALDEDDMSEEPMPYITEPDSFNQEPMAPEAEEDIDADLVDALLELAPLEPQEAAVGEVLSMASPTNICQCQRATLPTLPPGYLYGGLRVWIDNEHDPGRLTLTTVDEGAGAFLTLKARGRLAFDTGELVMLGQVGDELIRLHDRMDKQNND